MGRGLGLYVFFLRGGGALCYVLCEGGSFMLCVGGYLIHILRWELVLCFVVEGICFIFCNVLRGCCL